MSESMDAHFVRIPLESKSHEPQDLSGELSVSEMAMQHHPLAEISENPGHLLLLKLWQREEDLIGHRIGSKEAQLESFKREAFCLCSLFFAFHAIFFNLLFRISISEAQSRACVDWWVPFSLSLATSMALVLAVHSKVHGFWRVSRRLERERSDARVLGRCVQELRMKGSSFDLSREPQDAKRVKSSSVEIKWKLFRWCSKNASVVCLVCFTGMAATACRFIACA